MVTGLTLLEVGTVQKGMEKPGKWQSCGISWCHQPLETYLPSPELWAPQRDPITGVLELEGHGGDPTDPPQ